MPTNKKPVDKRGLLEPVLYKHLVTVLDTDTGKPMSFETTKSEIIYSLSELANERSPNFMCSSRFDLKDTAGGMYAVVLYAQGRTHSFEIGSEGSLHDLKALERAIKEDLIAASCHYEFIFSFMKLGKPYMKQAAKHVEQGEEHNVRCFL